MKQPYAAIAISLVSLGLLFACRPQNPPPPKRIGLQHLQGAKPTPVPGISAIPAKSVPPGQAAFTEADVRSWVQSHTLPGSLPKHSRLDNVQSVQFLREEDAAHLLYGERIGDEPGRMVCVAITSGDFVFSTPAKEKVLHFSLAAEVFDAQTGNFLLSAGLPMSTQPPRK